VQGDPIHGPAAQGNQQDQGKNKNEAGDAQWAVHIRKHSTQIAFVKQAVAASESSQFILIKKIR
jgi:hypothetical protein